MNPHFEIKPELLSMRYARCICHNTTPSKNDLPFFEYRGEGSTAAKHQCAHCAYYDIAHNNNPHKFTSICDHFEPHGAFEYDSYYCGCSGWD